MWRSRGSSSGVASRSKPASARATRRLVRLASRPHEAVNAAAYYDELAAAFGLSIDAVGPNFGTQSLLDVIADSAELASPVGEQTRLLWPADYGLRRIAIGDPALVYPHSLIWRTDNPHPALSTLRAYLGSVPPGHCDASAWAPSWARPG